MALIDDIKNNNDSTKTKSVSLEANNDMRLGVIQKKENPSSTKEVLEREAARIESDENQFDYHALNAMLNIIGEDGKIQFDKDRKAARQFFLQHVNQNTVFFHNLEEKLGHLVMQGYYESNVLEQYEFNFIRDLYDFAYGMKFRFDTFLGE